MARLAVRDVCDRARIDDVRIGDGRAIDDLDAGERELAGDALGVGLVELAAERQDRDAADVGSRARRRFDITRGPFSEERQIGGGECLRRVRIDAVALPAGPDAS
jgi:hypothetical protein